MLYAHSSALLERYVEEVDSDRTDELLAAEPDVVTRRHTKRQAQAARALGFRVLGA